MLEWSKKSFSRRSENDIFESVILESVKTQNQKCQSKATLPLLQCTYKVPSDGEHTTKKKHPQKSSLDFKRQ